MLKQMDKHGPDPNTFKELRSAIDFALRAANQWLSLRDGEPRCAEPPP